MVLNIRFDYEYRSETRIVDLA